MHVSIYVHNVYYILLFIIVDRVEVIHQLRYKKPNAF